MLHWKVVVKKNDRQRVAALHEDRRREDEDNTLTRVNGLKSLQ
jgi:hypothetical protein